ncbi:uncharacterized protein [Neodiprion pinetum]|uniref:uncharacterized protein n=1 Tax=Neodiprion pinetum TaxID=441929 RepID=UPI003711227C
MWKRSTLQESYEWMNILDDLRKSYNNTKHRTIRMKPVDVSTENKKQLYRSVYKPRQIKRTDRAQKFSVGDQVRISKYENVSEKGYTPNWTTKIFTVSKVKNTNPPTYKLTDYQDHPIEGGFYEKELNKVKHPDGYLVEKVLRKRGNLFYVKWLGFDSSHKSWIDKTHM